MRARRCTRERRLVLPITSRSPLAHEALAQELGQLGRAASARRSASVPSSRRMPSPEPGSTCTVGPGRALRHLVGAGAEQDEVPVAQPLEERHRLLDLVGRAHAARRPAPPPPCARPSRASRAKSPTASCSSPSASRTAATSASPSSGVSGRSSSSRMTDSRPLASRASRDAHDAALGVALDADDRMQQQAHAVARRPARPRAPCRRGTARRAR